MRMLYLASLALLCLAAAVDAADVAVGENCNADNTCAQDLVCDQGKCKIKIEGDCTGNKADKCISNAECKANKCKCKDNSLPNTAQDKCLKKIGQGCSDKAECISDLCSGKKCACGEKKVPSFAMDKCSAATGEACTQESDCGDNAACPNKICACKTSFFARPGEPCGLAVGANCPNPTDHCVTNAACTDKKCKCKADYTPDGKFCSGASAALASVMLMLAALVASRWM